ncbi:hypothetical protein [Mycolicibacterium sp. A43C]
MTVTVSGPAIIDVTGRKDSREWRAWSPTYRKGAGNAVVTYREQEIGVVAGVLTARLEPGPCVIQNPDGDRWLVTVPETDTLLWPLIQAAVQLPPETPDDVLAAAVAAYFDAHPIPEPGATDLSTARTSTAVTVLSSTGADAVLPAADGFNAGVMTAEMQAKLAGLEAYVLGQIAALIGAAPAELDTWIELVAAIQSNNSALAGITSALSGKVDKGTGNARVYIRNGSGAETTGPYASDATPGAFPVRDANGTFRVGTATDNAHPATKLQMDTADATKLNSDRGRALTVSGSNLIFDPRFEIPAIWAGDSRITISTEQKLASLRSLKYVSTSVADLTFDLLRMANGSGAGDQIYVAEGDTYQFSLWFYLPAAISGSGYANAYVRAQDSTGVNPNIFFNTNQINFSTATVGAWQKSSVQFTVPAGYDRIGVIGRFRDVPAGGVVYLGNPVLRDVTNDTKQSKVITGTTSTAVGTAAKVVTSTSTPVAGDIVAVTFTNGNSANNVTLNFNGTTAYPVSFIGTSTVNSGNLTLLANAVALFYFTGTAFQLTGANLNLIPATQAEIDASNGGYRLIQPSLLKANLDTKQTLSEKGAANGYAGLDSAGKVPIGQLPSSIMEYQGTWNASTNVPNLANGTGNVGDVYRVSTAGTRNFGAGTITFVVGDYAIYNGSQWERSGSTDVVASVAGKKGDVTLVKADVGLSNVDDTPDSAKPVSAAQQAALDGKAPSSHTHTLGQIGITGTPNGAKFLRDDGSWAVPPSGGGGGGGSSYDTYANMPAASAVPSGHLYHCADIDSVYRSSGTTWVQIACGGGPVIGEPPAVGTWTAVNLGTATVASDKGTLLLTAPAVNGTVDTLRAVSRSISGNPTITAKLDFHLTQSNGPGVYFGFTDGTKFKLWAIQMQNYKNLVALRQNWNNATSINGTNNICDGQAAVFIAQCKWWRLTDTGTSHVFSLSTNGIDWQVIDTISRTDFIASPTAFCVGLNTYGSGYTASMRLRQLAIA